MKNTIYITSFILIFIFASCKNDSSDNQSDSTQIETVDTNIIDTEVILGKEYSAPYICPNHCSGSGSDEFGECPVCGMEYIENLDTK